MGYEEVGRYRVACECGKGEVEHISEMDDWNRRNEVEIIHCEECKLKESIKKKKLSDEINRCYSLRKEVKLYFEKKYYRQWEESFRNCKTKKDRFDLLVNVGILSSSLPPAYFINKHKKADIPKAVLEPKTIKQILDFLHIKDLEYVKKIDELIVLNYRDSNRLLAEYHRNR